MNTFFNRGSLRTDIQVWCWLVICVMFASCSSVERAPQQPGRPRTVEMTRVVRIPTVNSAAQAEAAKLTVSPGTADELPEGPDGFDVTADGGFLITDPLRKRIAVFDRSGGYRSEWPVAFAADSVTIVSDNLVQVREARTGQLHLFDLQGKPAAGNPTPAPEPGEARLTGPGTGTVNWTAAAGRRGGPLEVQFERSGLKLLSLQAIAMDPTGDSYVALESTAGGDAVDLNKSVRRYSPDGQVIAETTDLPLDYFVRPTDEIRVRNGVVYQLMTTMSEVRINVWDTN